jgi:hypothetical protein
MRYGVFVGGVVGAGVVGTGSSGTAGVVVFPVAGAGAVGTGVENPFSSTDFGTRPRVDAICRTNASARKIPPHHQLTFVRRLPA